MVKWEGYPNSENSWEPIENLQPELVADYERTLQNGSRVNINTLQIDPNDNQGTSSNTAYSARKCTI